MASRSHQPAAVRGLGAARSTASRKNKLRRKGNPVSLELDGELPGFSQTGVAGALKEVVDTAAGKRAPGRLSRRTSWSGRLHPRTRRPSNKPAGIEQSAGDDEKRSGSPKTSSGLNQRLGGVGFLPRAAASAAWAIVRPPLRGSGKANQTFGCTMKAEFLVLMLLRRLGSYLPHSALEPGPVESQGQVSRSGIAK